MKFTIKCDIPDRWVPHFIAMLKYMQYCGSIGRSRRITFYADGDGDYQPKFEYRRGLFGKTKLPEPAKPSKEKDGDHYYDAG